MQLFERDLTGIYITEGKEGHLQIQKYLAAGTPGPMVAVVGLDPALFSAARATLNRGESELDYVGGLRGEPLEVVRGEVTGLPIPAHAEIALEGEVVPGRRAWKDPSVSGPATTQVAPRKS